jgi:hypothetical protein
MTRTLPFGSVGSKVVSRKHRKAFLLTVSGMTRACLATAPPRVIAAIRLTRSFLPLGLVSMIRFLLEAQPYSELMPT